jgi:iron(III) transport system permease protein
MSTRVAPRHRIGWVGIPVSLGLLLVVGLGLGVPLGTIGYWLFHQGHSTLPGTSLASDTARTVGYAAAAAAIASLGALPLALFSIRHRGPVSRVLERLSFLCQALPGLVVGLALVLFTARHLPWLYQTSALLVLAYAILLFPLAFVAVRASVAQARPDLDDVGRSLGLAPWRVMLRVVLPLVAPGLAAGFCLVFLSSVTELTATLLLVPTGVHTLATQFWAYQQDVSYGAAAPYAAVMVGVAAIPGYLLTLYFDRLPARQTRG